MDDSKEYRHRRIYLPWYTSDDDIAQDEGQENDNDGWVNYIRRNMQHPIGQESPFPDSSWSYTRHDSPFENDDKHMSKKSDQSIHDEVAEALYQNEEVDASKIKMIVLNGLVCLMGSVRNLLQKRVAERVTRSIPEVWSVRNDLKIDAEEKRSLTESPLN